MVSRQPTTNQKKNFDKFTTPNNNINPCFLRRLGALIVKVKRQGDLGHLRKERSYVLELRALKYAILAFSRLHPNAQSIHIQTDSMVALSYFVKMGRIETSL